MNREPITLRNLLMRARLQDQNVCVTLLSKGCIVKTFIHFSVDLLGLLKWKSHPNNLRVILPNVTNVKGEEIVKVWEIVLIFTFNSWSQNTTQKSISIVFCVSSIRHDSSLSKCRKQKQFPPGNTKNGARSGG